MKNTWNCDYDYYSSHKLKDLEIFDIVSNNLLNSKNTGEYNNCL